jgi:hypothetical protein
MVNDNEKVQNVELNQIKINRMTQRIYRLEMKNMVTNEKTNSEMMNEIRKIIETEAKKCF